MRRRTFLASTAAAAAASLAGSCTRRAGPETPPEELVAFGRRFVLGDGAGAGQVVTLQARPGPAIDLRSGALAVVDPWTAQPLPGRAMIDLPPGRQPTLLSTIDLQRGGKPAPIACAAAIGRLDQVARWRPLMLSGRQFRLDSDSALGAFCDMADAAVLRPLFGDQRRMFAVYERALEQQIVPVEAGGRVAAVAFLFPDGAATYPVHAGLGADGRAAAVLVDLKILNPGRPWNRLKPARMTGRAG